MDTEQFNFSDYHGCKIVFMRKYILDPGMIGSCLNFSQIEKVKQKLEHDRFLLASQITNVLV